MIDVALATCAALPHLDADERLLITALERRGLTAAPWVWSEPSVDWAQARSCVIRTTWDYTRHHPEFVAWAGRTGTQTRLWNSPGIVRWNTHKRYLRDLEARGVPIVPTEWLGAGRAADLGAILRRRGWDEVVLKPAVGATAREAVRVPPDGLERGQAHLDRLLPREGMLVQPFVDTVLGEGELSLAYVDGSLSHALRKRAAPGEWRVQDDFGGTLEAVAPRPDEIEVAERALAAVREPWLYARVDLLRDRAGRLCLIELELVEPALYFGWADGAADRLAEAIARRLEE